MKKEKSIELHIPSVLGSEKTAMDRAAAVAREMGFSEDRVEDLKTAIAEACINAIEHGNRLDESTKVRITLTVDDSKLLVAVHDEGRDFERFAEPDIASKINGTEKLRGMGMFLIESLMNAVEVETNREGGNTVKMVVYLEK